AELDLVGIGLGGDVDQLRIKSDNTATANNYSWIQASWGNIKIKGTKVTSWDAAVGGPDVETDTYGRAYIAAISTLDADGVTPHESRLDIDGSDIGYLGF